MRWYAEQPGADVAQRRGIRPTRRPLGHLRLDPRHAELARMKITQMREKLWGISIAKDVGPAVEVGVG